MLEFDFCMCLFSYSRSPTFFKIGGFHTGELFLN